MVCAIQGRVVDTVEKSFVGKDGKTVNYVNVSMIDEDAYMDTDRVFCFKVNPDLVHGLSLVGKEWKFRGSLSMNKGTLRFKCSEVVEAK